MKEYGNELAEFLYYTPGKIDTEGPVWPVRAGRNAAKPGYCVGPKSIECYSMHFVYDGEVMLEHGGIRKTLRKGDIFCLYPEQTYTYREIPGTGTLRMCWLAIDGDEAERLLELAGFRQEAPYVEQAIDRGIRETLDSILRLIRSTESPAPAPSVSLELRSLLYKLFSMLADDAGHPRGAEPHDWIRECMAYMELHATEGISVQQVAALAGVSRTYFSTVFTKQVGVSPVGYMIKIRMEKAKRLLRDTPLPITEIALTLGYPNLYSFTRAFKHYCSVPPGIYRIRQHGESGKDF